MTKVNKKSGYDAFWDKISGFYASNSGIIDRCVVVIMFLVLFGTRLYDISIKNQVHSDEVFSLMISTGNKYYNSPLPDAVYSGSELKEVLSADDKGGFVGAMSDIAQLWKNNGDAPHASLYYMVLRLALIGYDSFDANELAWRGGLLNLVFFALSFVIMYRLLRKVFGSNSLLVFAGLALAFGNWLAVKNTLLVREYQMAETAILAFTYIGISLIIALRNMEEINLKKYFVGIVLSVAFVMSLGYFNAVFVGLFGLSILFAAYKYRQKKLIFWLLLSAATGIVVAYIMYPGFFNFLLHDSVHKEKAFSSVRNIYGNVVYRDLVMQFFTLPGVILAGIALLAVLIWGDRKQLLKSGNFAWISVLVVVAMFVIQYASVLKMPRYYFPIVPLLVLVVLHVFKCLPKSMKGYFELLFILYFPVLNVLFPTRVNYRWKNLHSGLTQDAIIHKLNPNEVAQIMPCMEDSVKYTITSQDYVDISRNKETFVVTKLAIGISNDSIQSMKRLLWGRHIFLYKFKFIPEEERNNEGK